GGMSTFVKFFTKKKKDSGNKENDANLKRDKFERASTRSEVGTDTQQRERDRQAMRAVPNPYSVWTEPKKTRGPSSCPGGVISSRDSYNERRSVRQPRHERAGSVYGDMSGLRQYHIDGPPDSHHHHQHHRSSRRYGNELSMIEERSERSDRSFHHPQEWNRSSHRHPTTTQYVDDTSGDSDEEDGYVRKLEHKIQQLKDDRNGYRDRLENKKNELSYREYELKNTRQQLHDTEHQLGLALEKSNKQENKLQQCLRMMEQMRKQLECERKQAEELSLRLSEMSTSATSNGAMERLVSSSETSLEMEGEEEDNGGNDEVRNFRASDSFLTTVVGSTTGAADAPRATTVEEEMEVPRGGETSSPEFELRRSFSDMGPVSMIDGAGEEMAEEGGSWTRREKRRSFVKRSLLPPPCESESSDGEKVLLMERQVRKKGAVVKYDPNRRVPVKEKHYRRFGKPERNALERFTFLETEVTDISGMLSSPNEGNY
ncbi:hypothetical protein PENTCL1PPCAC_21756, partial [Pristionchus entomophagus]